MRSAVHDESLSEDSVSDTESEDPCFNEYSGFSPSPGITILSDRIDISISSEDFFRSYVRQRRPVVIKGGLTDTKWQGSRWTNDFLAQVAGDAKVLVEDRQSYDGPKSFGISAPKIEMKYGDFLRAIYDGETRYYMTTQDLDQFADECDELGLPKTVTAKPLSLLSDNFPVQPSILGNLIPHQISLWQGCTGKNKSTSSGLHHDFHDNLYVLIRGCKRFRLFPPSAAQFLHVGGNLRKVHRNGLIVYSSSTVRCPFVPIRADGAPLDVIARYRHKHAELKLANAEEQLQMLQESNSLDCPELKVKLKVGENLVSECEQQMEDTLDELLRYDDNLDEDDDVGSDCDAGEPTSKRCKRDADAVCNSSSSQSTNVPDHFSRVQLPQQDCDASTLFASFEEPEKIACLVVELHAGEMLYLPASWFHEVTSYDDKDGEDQDEESQSADNRGHLALNYWLYPPDGDSFEKPYLDNFWTDRWKRIQSDS